jgi:hypothetical protein
MGREVRIFEGHGGQVISANFSPDGRLVLTASMDMTTRLWNTETGDELARLVSFTEGTWAVVDPQGHFDTNNLEEIRGLHWIMSDDPLRAMPLELFMRDYYEPRLLPRRLARKPDVFDPVRPLQTLNRARPEVPAIRLVPGPEPGTVTAEVDVAGGTYTFEQTGATQVTGAYDLRLFRDGQLVGQWPEPKASTPDGVSEEALSQWQEDTQVIAAKDKTTVRFPGITLPHRPATEPVAFTAYAFNEDRVKSETAKATTPPASGPAVKKAYLIAVGVNDYGGAGWDLQFAAHDARQMAAVLRPRLEQAGYTTPEPTVLVSNDAVEEAIKEKIRAAIEGLAGRSTPDDVVVLFFSGHGYTGPHAAFYLLPSDSQPGGASWAHPSAATLKRLISADELARWLHRVDAAELVLIIDACHAAASIEAEGFKPGPLGSKGLGQLAYDKRMRVLAASQSDQAAREMGGQIGAGVLTYTLLHDGLAAAQAIDEHGQTTLKSWLEYPIKRVPHLFEEIRAGTVNDYGVPVTKDAVAAADVGATQREGAVQVPALFDYTKLGEGGIMLGRTR